MDRKMAAERNLWAFTVLLALLLTGIDAAAPSGLNVAVLYVILVLPSLWSRLKNFTYRRESALGTDDADRVVLANVAAGDEGPLLGGGDGHGQRRGG